MHVWHEFLNGILQRVLLERCKGGSAPRQARSRNGGPALPLLLPLYRQNET